jgi:hypothetical protein
MEKDKERAVFAGTSTVLRKMSSRKSRASAARSSMGHDRGSSKVPGDHSTPDGNAPEGVSTTLTEVVMVTWEETATQEEMMIREEVVAT